VCLGARGRARVRWGDTKYQHHSIIALIRTKPLKSIARTIQELNTPCKRIALDAVNHTFFPIKPELDIPELVINPELDTPESVMNPELVIEAEGVAEGDGGGSKCAARSLFVPKMPALRDPKQDVATQREKRIAPVGPKRRDPKSCCERL
jgi:hypothetical protein